jgi:formate hydrogenlyase subunit 4
MIHEVMVLDHGGPALGLIEYGSAVKLFALSALVVRVFIPYSANPYWSWLAFAGGLLALSIGVGIVESVMARLRLLQVPVLLVAASLLSAFGIVLVAR